MEGSLSLILSNDEIDFDEISKNILLKPSKVIIKGQLIALGRKSLEDRWIYSVDFQENDFREKVNLFLATLILYQCYIQDLSNRISVELNFYFNSDMGQLGYTLDRKQVRQIQKMGLNVSFHILSQGLVE